MHNTPTGVATATTAPSRPAPLPFARHALAAALCLIGSAHATEIPTANPDLAVRFDNTIKYNYGHRIGKQNASLLKSANYDDGDRNFDRGTVSNRIDWMSELDVVFDKRIGVRVSAAAWYDAAYGRFDNTNVASSNHLDASGAKAIGLSDTTRRYHRGGGELLDAFVFGNFDIGDMPVNVKLGQHTLYWGESLMTPIHGVNYGQAPVNLLKGYSVPGSDAKELFMPRQALSAQMSVTPELGLAAQYFFKWKPARLPETGSFLGFYDYAFQGGESFFLGPLGQPAVRGPDSRAPDTGDFGVAARWSPAWLDGTAGLYLRRTSDLLPQANVRLVGLPAALFGPNGAAVCTAFIPGAAVAGNNCLFYPGKLNKSQYQLEYASNIDIVGLSLSKSVGGVAVGADLSFRRNMALYSTPALLMPAGTNPAIINALNAKVAPQLVVVAADTPQAGEVSGTRGNTFHAVVNLLGTTAATPFSDASTWATELVWMRVAKLTQGAQFYRGRDSYPGIDKVSRDFVSISASYTPTWFQVRPGVDMQMPLSYSVGLSGNSAVQAGGNKHAGSYAAGLAFDVRQKYRFDIKYVNFFGPLATDPTSGAVTSFAGVTSLLKDRGFLAATFKTTF